jgi:predicted NAD/FAD-dependent oxidoreductase
MNPKWSADHFERDATDLAASAWRHATKLLRWPDSTPDWFEAKRWMYAHPSSGADVAAARSGEDEGIYIAGDALVGKGRLNLALESGLRVAERIIAGI